MAQPAQHRPLQAGSTPAELADRAEAWHTPRPTDPLAIGGTLPRARGDSHAYMTPSCPPAPALRDSDRYSAMLAAPAHTDARSNVFAFLLRGLVADPRP